MSLPFSGNHAAEFQIASYLGYMLSEAKQNGTADNTRFVIISDKPLFVPIYTFWKDRGFNVELKQSPPQPNSEKNTAAKPQQSSSTEDPHAILREMHEKMTSHSTSDNNASHTVTTNPVSTTGTDTGKIVTGGLDSIMLAEIEQDIPESNPLHSPYDPYGESQDDTISDDVDDEHFAEHWQDDLQDNENEESDDNGNNNDNIVYEDVYEDEDMTFEPDEDADSSANITVNDEKNDNELLAFVINTKTKVFHSPNCRYAKSTNTRSVRASWNELKAEGFTACGTCFPFDGYIRPIK